MMLCVQAPDSRALFAGVVRLFSVDVVCVEVRSGS